MNDDWIDRLGFRFGTKQCFSVGVFEIAMAEGLRENWTCPRYANLRRTRFRTEGRGSIPKTIPRSSHHRCHLPGRDWRQSLPSQRPVKLTFKKLVLMFSKWTIQSYYLLLGFLLILIWKSISVIYQININWNYRHVGLYLGTRNAASTPNLWINQVEQI